MIYTEEASPETDANCVHKTNLVFSNTNHA